jgi:hypothetical protein
LAGSGEGFDILGLDSEKDLQIVLWVWCYLVYGQKRQERSQSCNPSLNTPTSIGGNHDTLSDDTKRLAFAI